MAAISEYARKRERQRNKDIYNWYKSKGICPRCKTQYAAPGRVHCEKCIVENRARVRKFFGEYNATKCKERRERLKAQGLCVCCGKPAVESRVLCVKCARRNAEAQQVKRIKNKIARERNTE